MSNDYNFEFYNIQKSYLKKELTFDQYSQKLIELNNNIIKADDNFDLDKTRGGKLVKKNIIDKNGKKVTKWVKTGEDESSDDNNTKEDSGLNKNNKKYKQSDFLKNASKASELALDNAIKYSNNQEIIKIARNELLKRKENLKSYIDLSLMPDFMLESYIDQYKLSEEKLTPKIEKSLSEYRDNDYMLLNKELRNNSDLSKEKKEQVKNIDKAISLSELKQNVVLYRGLSSKNNEMFVNYLKSLSPGDIYEEKSYSSTSLLESQATKFKDLYSDSHNNFTLKIYASKGQNALCMQHLGGEDNKEMYKDEYEFLLPRDSKFQIISNNNNEIEIKLL